MPVRALPEKARAVLVIAAPAAYVTRIEAALAPLPVRVAATAADAHALLQTDPFDAALLWPLTDDARDSIELLQSLAFRDRPIPVAFIATREDLPALVRAGRTELPTLSLSASPSRLRRSLLKILGAPPTELTVGQPNNDGEALVMRTVRKAARLPGAMVRQSSSAGAHAVQVVLPRNDEALQFQRSLQDEWGLALRPGDVKNHPVLQTLNGISGSQEVYVRALDEPPSRWAYAAFLPWKKSNRVTLLAGTVAAPDDTSAANLAARAQALAVGEQSRLGVPALPQALGAAQMLPEYQWIVTPTYIGPDRRRAPTPMFSRYLVIGRRRTLVAGQWRTEGFIDRNSHWVAQAFAAYLVLSTIDTSLTWVFVRSGKVSELNPLLRPLIFEAHLLFFCLKNLLAIGAFVLVARFEKFRFGLTVILGLLGSYLALDVYWAGLLLR